MVEIIAVNALIGIALFEWAYYQTRRHRKVDEERDSLFPAWRRLDVKRWSRLKLYPCAITIMPVRLIWAAFSFIFLFLMAKICYRKNDSNKPLSCRRKFF